MTLNDLLPIILILAFLPVVVFREKWINRVPRWLHVAIPSAAAMFFIVFAILSPEKRSEGLLVAYFGGLAAYVMYRKAKRGSLTPEQKE